MGSATIINSGMRYVETLIQVGPGRYCSPHQRHVC
jgi:hypothetical protein